MIKRLFAVVVCLFALLLICGCDGYRETDNCYIVSAIGFDAGEKMKIFVEVVSTGGGERSSAPTAEIISGEGDTPENAMFLLTGQTSKILMLDHCTALVIGESVKAENFKKITDYANRLKEINPAVYMVRTESAEKLLGESQPISVARGFDIAGNIRETENDTGIRYENRFFELFAAYKNKRLYKMPFLTVKKGRIIIDGEAVYDQNEKKDFLSNEESLIYSFFINRNSGGKIYIGRNFADVSSCRFEYKKGKYVGDLHIKNESGGFKEAFKKECDGFLKDHREKLGLKADTAEIKTEGGV